MKGLVDLLFPPRCPFCRGGVEEDGTICPNCQAALPWRTEGRAHRRLELLEDCVSALGYTGPVPGCVRRFKFSHKRGYARALGLLVAQCVQDHLGDVDFDLISWPPLSPKSLRGRGYDQARLLAHAVAESRGTQEAALFAKRNAVGRQSRIQDPAARRANVLGAYALTDPELVRGRRVLLVDDVVTSGATLTECARVLLTAGAAGVWAATLACADGRRSREN